MVRAMASTTRAIREHCARSHAPEAGGFIANRATLRRVSALTELGTMTVDGSIGLRFLLKLLAANTCNPFAAVIYFLTAPFPAILSV